MSRPPESSRYCLLVEGPDDAWSIINLLKRHGYDWDDDSIVRPYVNAVGGKDSLLRAPLLQAAAKSYDRLGIVVDADLEPSDRWKALRGALRGVEDLPDAPSGGGTIIESARVPGFGVARLGVWLMPDNQAPGTLEDFLAKLVPADDRCWPHADVSTRKARDELEAPLEEKDHAKGVIHTWLAWQKQPGQPLGQAITARAFAHDTPQALEFVGWFLRLFR
jgi:hypothetical protein